MVEASKTGQVKFLVQGEQGPSGARQKWVDWATTSVFLSGTNGEEWQYYTFYNEHAYLCLISFNKAIYTKTPDQSVVDNDGYFVVADEVFFAFINFLLVNKLTAEHINADNIKAINVDISGKMTSDSGTIGGIKINADGLGSAASEIPINTPMMLLKIGQLIYEEMVREIINGVHNLFTNTSKMNPFGFSCEKSGAKNSASNLTSDYLHIDTDYFEALKIRCGNIGLKITSSGIYKSTDGGTNWTAL